MKYAVVGGDRRAAILCALLARDGHRVCCYALERADIPQEAVKTGCLQGCVYGADCVILPVPSEKGGLLNTPLSDSVLSMREVLETLWPGQIVVGGRLSDESCALAIREKLSIEDIMLRPDFTVGNAALTAECALGRLMDESGSALAGSNVLVCGWGRIGKLLCLKLAALGAHVTAAARARADRAMAAALGLGSVDYDGLEAEIGAFGFIINTVPARVLTDAALCMAADGAVIMELASPPGGFDRTLAENIGLHVVPAPGLPGQRAPESAARLIRSTVYDIMREQEE